MTADNQKILLQDSPDGSSYSFDSSNVHVSPPNETKETSETHRDSGKVKSNILSEYKWETKLYDGKLCTVTKDGTLIAYVLHSSSGHAVRIFDRERKLRGLIKNQFSGSVTDIAWSHELEPLLGVTDDHGNVYIYAIKYGPDGKHDLITAERQLKIVRGHRFLRRDIETSKIETSLPQASDSGGSGVTRIVWCPFIPEKVGTGFCGEDEETGNRSGDGLKNMNNNNVTSKEGSTVQVGQGDATNGDGDLMDLGESASNPGQGLEEDIGKMIAVYRGNEVEVMFLDTILSGVTAEQINREVRIDDLALLDDGSYTKITEKSMITAATLSPDATALALATMSGEAKFYILETLDDIKCAYEWKPHGGKPVDSLIFLDNLLTSCAGEQFWRFAVTGADGNRELILWNCENWHKLGTLTLAPRKSSQDGWGLSLEKDWTGQFLILSDIERRSFYSIEVKPDSEGMVRFRNISDFPLCMPILDLAVISMERTPIRTFSPMEDGSNNGATPSPPAILGEDDGFSETIKGLATQLPGVHMQLIAVNPKSLQVLEVSFAPASVYSDGEFGNLEEEIGERDLTPEIDSPSRKYSRASPTGEEVSEILAHEQTEDVEAKVPLSTSNSFSQRPMTPVAHTLRDEYGESSGMPSRLMSVEDAESTLGSLKGDILAVRMELERVVAHLERVETRNNQLMKLASKSEAYERKLEAVEKGMSHLEVSCGKLEEKLGPECFSATIHDSVAKSVASSIKNEMKNSAGPYVAESVRNIKGELVNHINQSLDTSVKEHVGKLMKSKTLTEQLAKCISEALIQEIQTDYRDAFQRIVVPSFDQSTRLLFSQMNELFAKGVNDYIGEVRKMSVGMDQHNEAYKAQAQAHLSALSEEMKSLTDRQMSVVGSTLEKQLEKMTERLESTVVGCVKSLYRDGVGRVTGPESLHGRSVNATPAQQTDRQVVQQEIAALVKHGDFNEAFKKALSACDLWLLMFLCGKVDTTTLFRSNGCILEMPVLLSLLQQISNDLSTQTELKIKYMTDAIMVLDESELVDVHLPTIIDQIQNRLKGFLQQNPSSPHTKAVKMVLMASSALSAGRKSR